MEVPQGVFHGLALGFTQLAEFVAFGKFFIGAAELGILAQLSTVFREFFQTVLVHFAQIVVVHHTVKVGDH